MDQITISVDVGDGVAQEGQVRYWENTGLEGIQIAHPAGGRIESVQSLSQLVEPILGGCKGPFADQVQVRPHNLEGNHIEFGLPITAGGNQVHGETKIVIVIKEHQLTVARGAQVIEGASRQKNLFALALPFSERERPGKWLNQVAHGRKGGEKEPFLRSINRLTVWNSGKMLACLDFRFLLFAKEDTLTDNERGNNMILSRLPGTKRG